MIRKIMFPLLLLLIYIFASTLIPSAVIALSAEQKKVLQSGAYYFNVEKDNACPLTTNSAGVATGNTYIVGDSISTGLHLIGFEDQLSKVTGGSTAINHDVGRSITQPGSEIRVSGLQAVENDKDLIKNAKNVVVILGTNPNNPFEQNLKTMIEKLKSANPGAQYYWVDIGATNETYVDTWNGYNQIIYNNAATQGYTVISRYKALFGQDKDPLNIDKSLNVPGGGDNIHGGYQQLGDEIIRVFQQGSRGNGSSSGTCACVALSGADNKAKIWNYLVAKNLNPKQIAGIMGNLQSESAGTWDPRIVEYGYKNSRGEVSVPGQPSSLDDVIPPNQPSLQDGQMRGQPGYGIVQWSGGRKDNLQAFSDSRAIPPNSLGLQLDFLWEELNTAYKQSVLEPILASTSLEEVTYIFLSKFEVPADIPGTRPTRVSNALAILAELGTGAATGGGTPSC